MVKSAGGRRGNILHLKRDDEDRLKTKQHTAPEIPTDAVGLTEAGQVLGDSVSRYDDLGPIRGWRPQSRERDGAERLSFVDLDYAQEAQRVERRTKEQSATRHDTTREGAGTTRHDQAQWDEQVVQEQQQQQERQEEEAVTGPPS